MDEFIKKNIDWIAGKGIPKSSDPVTVAAGALGRLARRDKRALAIAGVQPGDSPQAIGNKAKDAGVIARLKMFFTSWKPKPAKIQLTGNVASSRNLTPSIPKPGTIPEALPLPSVYELQSENRRLLGQLSALSGDYKTLAAEFEFFKANPSAQVKTAASRRAAGIVSGSFCAALPADGLESFDRTKSRSDFGKLSPQEKADFMRGGGKLTD